MKRFSLTLLLNSYRGLLISLQKYRIMIDTQFLVIDIN